MNRVGLVVLGVFAFFCGVGMIELGITDPDFELASRVFSVIFGVLFIVGAAAIVLLETGGLRNLIPWGKDAWADLFCELQSEISPGFKVVTKDQDKIEQQIRTFRKDYTAFFDKHGISENDPVQSDVTQLNWHTLFLQKRRLDRKGIRMDLVSERLHYGSLQPVSKNQYFDGKYQICDVTETLKATQTFKGEDGKTLHTRKSLQGGWYRILSAARIGEDHVVCPNCGIETLRDHLIDGCDFCGTKFTVEDLGHKISDFWFRPDYEAEYARYTDVRATYFKRVGLLVGVPVFILCAIMAFIADKDIGGPFMLRVAAFMFAVGLLTATAVALAEVIFIFSLFPVLQARASFRYLSRKRLDRMKAKQDQDHAAEKKVRAFDPLFSISGFYADLQNMLAVIHFADAGREAEAFSDGKQAEDQIRSRLSGYKDVIDLQQEDVRLEDYQVKDGMQMAVVSADLSLLYERGGSIKKEQEKLNLLLVKSAKCKTQAVCAPSFTVCKKCGASISLMDGKVCPSCGHERNLSETGWAIRAYGDSGDRGRFSVS